VTQIDELLTRLSSADLAGAEGALARLAIEGARTIEPLLAAFPGAPDSARMRMLRLLARVPDSRAVPLLTSTATDGPDDLRRLAVRALGAQPAQRSRGVLMGALATEQDEDIRAEIVGLLARLAGGETPEILDPVLDILFAGGEALPVRRAALVALSGLKPQMARQLLERLADAGRDDAMAPEIRELLQEFPENPLYGLPALTAEPWDTHGATPSDRVRPALLDVPRVLSTLATEGEDPDTAYRCSRALQALPKEARRDLAERLDASWPLSVLDGVLDTFRGDSDLSTLGALAGLACGLSDRIRREPDTELNQQLSLRHARVHRLIAQGGARLAIADLKEALRRTDSPPHDLVLALASIGRAEDLADILGVHERSDSWLRHEIEEAARAIIQRVRPRRLRRLLQALPAAQASILRPLLPQTDTHRSARPGAPGPGGAA